MGGTSIEGVIGAIIKPERRTRVFAEPSARTSEYNAAAVEHKKRKTILDRITHLMRRGDGAKAILKDIAQLTSEKRKKDWAEKLTTSLYAKSLQKTPTSLELQRKINEKVEATLENFDATEEYQPYVKQLSSKDVREGTDRHASLVFSNARRDIALQREMKVRLDASEAQWESIAENTKPTEPKKIEAWQKRKDEFLKEEKEKIVQAMAKRKIELHDDNNPDMLVFKAITDLQIEIKLLNDYLITNRDTISDVDSKRIKDRIRFLATKLVKYQAYHKKTFGIKPQENVLLNLLVTVAAGAILTGMVISKASKEQPAQQR